MPKSLTKEEFVKKARDKHGDKYIYDKVDYKNNSSKVIITCPSHGDFSQTPHGHLKGQGCKKCFYITHSDKQRNSTEDFIIKAREIHGDKYIYDEVDYKTNKERVIITCKIHGNFFQVPYSHLRGKGCMDCLGKTRKTDLDFIKDAKIIHADTYNYDKVNYTGSGSKVIINCPYHGDFSQTPHNHLKGQGCPYCRPKTSKPAQSWLKSLGINNLIYDDGNTDEFKIPGTKYSADGYDPETNTIYEFHGDYWHGNPSVYNQNDINVITKTSFGELYRKTQERKNELINLGYNVIEIWENDWKKQLN